jgi:Holliday junction resolvase RusA-like endonuclease
MDDFEGCGCDCDEPDCAIYCERCNYPEEDCLCDAEDFDDCAPVCGCEGGPGICPNCQLEKEDIKVLISLTLPGRPVPWARARKSKRGGFFTPPKQAGHRDALAMILRMEAKAQGIEKFDGPVLLDLVFDYAQKETRIEIHDLGSVDGIYRITRPDIDNLLKQIMEAIEDSGLLADDAQVAVVRTRKVQ